MNTPEKRRLMIQLTVAQVLVGDEGNVITAELFSLAGRIAEAVLATLEMMDREPLGVSRRSVSPRIALLA
jgi:hypothetical protein